jgi:hypothetical protein
MVWQAAQHMQFAVVSAASVEAAWLCSLSRTYGSDACLTGCFACLCTCGADCHLQTQLQETQRLKQVVDMECQKAAAAAMHAKTLEMQLAASAAAVQDAQRAQMELQQQVRSLATIGAMQVLLVGRGSKVDVQFDSICWMREVHAPATISYYGLDGVVTLELLQDRSAVVQTQPCCMVCAVPCCVCRWLTCSTATGKAQRGTSKSSCTGW